MLSSTAGRFVYVLFFAAISIGCEETYVSAPQSKPSSSVSEPDELKTTRYIEMLDPRVFELKGVRSLSLMYSPERVPEGVNDSRWYDYVKLETMDERLRGIDRSRALAALFSRVVPLGSSGEEAITLVHGFISRSIVHFLQPQSRDGALVLDPLLILELGEGRCGQKARLLVDIMQAGGFEARVVQLGGHVASEVKLQDRWVYVDPDLFINGDLARKDGELLSVAELSRFPEIIDAMSSYLETSPGFDGTSHRAPYPSFIFNRSSYIGYSPMYYYRGELGQYGLSLFHAFGEFLSTVLAPDIEMREEASIRFTPWTPFITEMILSDEEVHLKWFSNREDEEPEFRVYLSKASRGWNYPASFFPAVQSFMRSTPPTPGSFKKRNLVPPSEVALVVTKGEGITIRRDEREELFVTVDATDEYGRSIGRQIFSPSQEVIIPPLEAAN